MDKANQHIFSDQENINNMIPGTKIKNKSTNNNLNIPYKSTSSIGKSPSITPSINPRSYPRISPHTTPSVSPRFSPCTTPSVSPRFSPCTTPNITPRVSPHITPSVSPRISPRAILRRLSGTLSSSTSTTPSITPRTTPRNIQSGSSESIESEEIIRADMNLSELSIYLSDMNEYSDSLLLSLNDISEINIDNKIKIYSNYIHNLKLNIYNKNIHSVYDHDPINHEDFINNESKIKIIPCGHYFFPETINRWFTKSPTCPLCKYNIFNNILFPGK
uniref:UvrD-like helicase n=1 Tax=Pithovirus LCPAC101 TaxID=2506586 RepID=A0A481Z5A0_9VIRU|nr:MAG: UvrD-like helicase [Pithovirus LCPAC101]